MDDRLQQQLQQSEEAMLVILAQQGDGGAFRTLVDRYDRRLLYFIRRILNGTDEAFDVLQSVWLQVHRQLSSLRSPRAFRVWIYRIAHHRAVSALRRRTRRPVLFDDPPIEQVSGDVAEESQLEAAELVHKALAALSVDHRRVLTLRFLEDMSIEDIADVLECSTGTIKSRLHYARSALRRRIEEIEHG